MKPDIVFFGEGLPDEFHDKMAEDKDQCDLLIVIGSSLKVRPVALIPSKYRIVLVSWSPSFNVQIFNILSLYIKYFKVAWI